MDGKNDKDTTGRQSGRLGSGFGGHVVRGYVIYTEPGKIPRTKGPFSNDDQIENMLLKLPEHCEKGTVYLVAHITHCHDLWIATARDFLTVRDLTCPNTVK